MTSIHTRADAETPTVLDSAHAGDIVGAFGRIRRDGSGPKFERVSCECLLCGFTTASYAWPSAARLIASRIRT